MTTVKELLDEQIEQQEEEERIMFIRKAAIQIYANVDNVSEAWHKAKWLWANKPEDC